MLAPVWHNLHIARVEHDKDHLTAIFCQSHSYWSVSMFVLDRQRAYDRQTYDVEEKNPTVMFVAHEYGASEVRHPCRSVHTIQTPSFLAAETFQRLTAAVYDAQAMVSRLIEDSLDNSVPVVFELNGLPNVEQIVNRYLTYQLAFGCVLSDYVRLLESR